MPNLEVTMKDSRDEWIEKRMSEILPTSKNLRGMAYDSDAIKDLGDNDVLLFHDPMTAARHLKYRWDRYRLEVAENDYERMLQENKEVNYDEQ